MRGATIVVAPLSFRLLVPEVHDAALLLEAPRRKLAPRGGHRTDHAYALLATWRRLKTKRSHRTVPLGPQLEEIPRPYVFDLDRPPGQLLFPANHGGMRPEVRKLLDRLGERAGWKAGEIRSKMCRHTYCAARLQTLDHGAPVGPYTVARELGHGSTAMVEKVYSHLGTLRHRSAAVEYRVEQHAAALADRLVALDNVTENGTQLQDDIAA